MTKCKCTLAQRLTGDGCRICQPQEYIDRLEALIDDERKENTEHIVSLENKLATLVDALRIADANKAKWIAAHNALKERIDGGYRLYAYGHPRGAWVRAESENWGRGGNGPNATLILDEGVVL